ncbi:GNAT family N-acetyltransferase [Robertmurraya siralis]|uniref:GNAT family N-acetyltransferase n=1 Tax=Robertmurraya siralis TaxID=77777 RepID=UPI0010FA3D9B|nr:GNAT family N-acetyltransferase [Robertmurraya siralis]
MIRFYQKGDEHEINALFFEVFGKQRSLLHWNWKFMDNHLQQSLILIDEQEGQLAGHVALVPSEAKWHDREVKLGARNDTMVSPKFRGKGIYGDLNKALISSSKQHDYDYLYGYPAEKAKKLFIRYTDATEIAQIPRLMRINRLSALVMNRIPLLKLAKPIFLLLDRFFTVKESKPPAAFEIKSITHCGSEFDQLWEQAKNVAPILLKRDAKFLNWRFHNHPDRNYQMLGLFENGTLLGYAVIHVEEKKFGKGTVLNGTIVDLLAIEKRAVWDALIRATLQKLRQADIIQTWALPHTELYPLLKQQRFVHKDSPMSLVGKYINEDLHESETTDSIENWYITPADVDSF